MQVRERQRNDFHRLVVSTYSLSSRCFVMVRGRPGDGPIDQVVKFWKEEDQGDSMSPGVQIVTRVLLDMEHVAGA